VALYPKKNSCQPSQQDPSVSLQIQITENHILHIRRLITSFSGLPVLLCFTFFLRLFPGEKLSIFSAAERTVSSIELFNYISVKGGSTKVKKCIVWKGDLRMAKWAYSIWRLPRISYRFPPDPELKKN